MFTVQSYEVTKAAESGLTPYPLIGRQDFSTYGHAKDFAVQKEQQSISKVSSKKTVLCAVISPRGFHKQIKSPKAGLGD